MKRVGYDMDSGRYTYRDSSGKYYMGGEGARYGEMVQGSFYSLPLAIARSSQHPTHHVVYACFYLVKERDLPVTVAFYEAEDMVPLNGTHGQAHATSRGGEDLEASPRARNGEDHVSSTSPSLV